MKVHLLFFLLFLGFYQQLLAQDQSVGGGLSSISNFYSVRYDNRDLYRSSAGAGLRFTYEQTVKQLSTGKLTWGAMMGFGRSDAWYNRPGWKSRYYWSHLLLSGRASYVYPYSDKLDLYGGLHLGLHIASFRESYDPPVPVGYQPSEWTRMNLYGGMFVGGEYRFQGQWAAFAEFGYDLMWFTLGAKLYL